MQGLDVLLAESLSMAEAVETVIVQSEGHPRDERNTLRRRLRLLLPRRKKKRCK